jgi:glycosyltransferase involved in cell wall biosynthesis
MDCMVKIDRLAVYSTVYAGVEPYLRPWYQSVLAQTDRDFDLWVAVDSLSPDYVKEKTGAGSKPINFAAGKKGTPARIRECALQQLVNDYDAIVFVDSDDLLYPTRVESARKALEQYDVTACSLTIIDEAGSDLGISFGQTDGEELATLLPRYNVFGMSNTAYRCDVLRNCFPLGDACELVDWALATRAWAAGANLNFNPRPQMAYRQYASNVAPVLLPFSNSKILKATNRVLSHYRCMLESEYPVNGKVGDRLRSAQCRATLFHEAISISAETLADYVKALNKKTPRYLWWWCVAHPELEYIWKA